VDTGRGCGYRARLWIQGEAVDTGRGCGYRARLWLQSRCRALANTVSISGSRGNDMKMSVVCDVIRIAQMTEVAFHLKRLQTSIRLRDATSPLHGNDV
jgi:hypothetical protein